MKLLKSCLLTLGLLAASTAWADGSGYHPWNGLSPEDLEANYSCRLAQQGLRSAFNFGLSNSASEDDAWREIVRTHRELTNRVCGEAQTFLMNTAGPLLMRYADAVARNVDGSLNEEVASLRSQSEQAQVHLCVLNNVCSTASQMLSAMIDHPELYRTPLLQSLSQARACSLAYYGLMSQLYCGPGRSLYSLSNPWSTAALGYRGVSSGHGLPGATCAAYAPIIGTSQSSIRLDPAIDISYLISPTNATAAIHPRGDSASLREQAMRAAGFRESGLMMCEPPIPTALKLPEGVNPLNPPLVPAYKDLLHKHYDVLFPADELQQLDEDLKGIPTRGNGN